MNKWEVLNNEDLVLSENKFITTSRMIFNDCGIKTVLVRTIVDVYKDGNIINSSCSILEIKG